MAYLSCYGPNWEILQLKEMFHMRLKWEERSKDHKLISQRTKDIPHSEFEDKFQVNYLNISKKKTK